MCGRVIRHTPLAVDFWKVRSCPGTRLFFLSHMHSDHTAGLTSTWSHRPIYCSPITATLLRLKLQVKDEWIHPLELGDPHLLPLDDVGQEKLTVTLMDANHCPGAVMFLFEGYFGSILYTGDFRYTPSMLWEPCLSTNAVIDVLYLDDTNCDPSLTLPTREQATQQIKDIIHSHPKHNIVIGLYSLGKESLLVELALEFKTWVEVSAERMETLKALELPYVFTTESGAGRIRAVMQSEISSAAVNQWNQGHPTLAIFPTSRPLISFHPDVHIVQYSDHSSYQELEDFVSALKPSLIEPIVRKSLPGSLVALQTSKTSHEIQIPESVTRFMLTTQERNVKGSGSRFPRRHTQPLIPKGVVFESPQRVSMTTSEGEKEEKDADSSERDSCTNLNLNRKRKSVEDSPRIIQKISNDRKEREPLPLRNSKQNYFFPVKMLNKKSFPETLTKMVSGTGSIIQNHQREDCSHVLPDEDGNSHHNDEKHPKEHSCASLNVLKVHWKVSLEELENSLLERNLFSEEDMKPRGLLYQRPMQQSLQNNTK